jgi:hypothetical protein
MRISFPFSIARVRREEQQDGEAPRRAIARRL